MPKSAPKILDRALLPLFWALSRRPRIFMFHSVGLEPVELNTGEQGPQASPQLFEAFIDWLTTHATVVTVNDLVRDMKQTRRRSDRLAAISLDDGYEDNYSIAYPILRRRNLPATIFITGAMIRADDDISGPGLSKSQIKEMHSEGIEFGAHTMSHPHLTRISSAEAQLEVARSKELVEDITASPCSGFCYPYGAVNSNIREIVRSGGFSYAVTTQDRIFHSRDNFLLPRTVLPPSPNATDFAVRLSGAHSWRQSAYVQRNRLRNLRSVSR